MNVITLFESIKRTPYRYVAAPILSGALLYLAFPAPGITASAWVCLIPLLSVVTTGKKRYSFSLGLLAGVTAYASILYWLLPMIEFNTHSYGQAAAAFALLILYLASYIGIWSLLLRIPDSTYSVFRFSLYAASLWVSLEYARTYFLTGFPWALLGYSQWKFLPFIQIAQYTGVFGISFIIVWSNVGILQFIRTRRWLPFLLLTLTIITVTVLGKALFITHETSHPPYIKVAVLQGNIDQYKKFDPQYRDEIIRTYAALISSAAVHKPDVFIWPETAVPGYLPADPLVYAWMRSVAQQTASFHLVGAPFYNGGTRYYNASFLFGTDGGILGWHQKTHLVPFGEFIPLRKTIEPYFPVLASMGDYRRGTASTVLSINSVLWAPTICSENFFGDTVASFVMKGAEVIVNQTNDAWFFDTAAPEQHFIMNVFRAIENRRTVVVSGNTGVSGIIEPSGKISTRVPVFSPQYFISSISLQKEVTFYTRWNDVFAKLCVAITLFMMLMSFIRRFRRRRSNHHA